MNITADHIRILTALRDASALRREPTAAVPDGHRKMFTLVDLAQEGRLASVNGFTSDGLCAAARSLRKHTFYVAGRTMHTVTSYGITDEGRAYLASLEKAAGVTDLVAAELALEQAELALEQAELALEQAELALEQATLRCQAAMSDLIRLRREVDVRGSLNVLLDNLKEGAR
jgi:exonuclease VII small subunit